MKFKLEVKKEGSNEWEYLGEWDENEPLKDAMIKNSEAYEKADAIPGVLRVTRYEVTFQRATRASVKRASDDCHTNS